MSILPRIRRLAIIGTIAVLAGVTPASGAAPEPDQPLDAVGGEIVHSWALVPAGTEDNPGNRSNFSYSGGPGAVIEDALTLMNLGNEDLPFRIYATDAFNNDAGDFTLLTGDEVPTDVGTWIDLELDTIVVDAGTQVTIPFRLSIPENATSGDHAGAILAASPTTAIGVDDEAVTVDRRAGSRLFVRVDGPIVPDLAVADLTTDYSQTVNPFAGSANVDYVIENRGNVRLSGATTASVSGPFGLGRSTAPTVRFDELLPGESYSVSVEVDGVPALLALATEVTLDDITQGDGSALDPVTRTARTFAPPITLLLVLLLVIFAIVARRAYRRHRQPQIEVIEPQAGSRSDSEMQLT